MKILKRFVDEEVWNETTQEECLDHTEGSGYWKPGSVLSMLAEGHMVHTPFARYKAVEHSVELTVLQASASCSFDPSTLTDIALGMFHCPECGEMIVAGIAHPDYSAIE